MYIEEYERLKNLVNTHLFDYLPSEASESKTVLDAMKYSLEAGGKRIRPILLLAACKMAGGNEADGLGFACALEYIHTYSLIHDDLPAMDDDDLRRGKPTSHKVFGEAAAILAGDGLLNRAYEVLLTDMETEGKTHLLPGKLRAARIISEAAGCDGMVGGQMADLEAEKRMADPAAGYACGHDLLPLLEYIHRNKTGALMRAAVTAGGCIGGASQEMLMDLRCFGDKLGLAFQIADDILDICGDTQTLGKPVGSDKENQKLTYPALLGLEEARQLFLKTHQEAIAAIEKYGEKASFLVEEANQLARRTC